MTPRKWVWDFDFFKHRDATTAYWAGFLMADGHIRSVRKNTSLLVVYIQKGDAEHIGRFCDDLKLSRDAIYIRKEGSVGVQPGHPNLIGDLEYWGIIPRKTYNFKRPEVNDPELIRHYLRGWADGDGQIYASGTGARFTVSGNIPALEWYVDKLRELGYSGGCNITYRTNEYGLIYIGGKYQVKEVIDLLLKDGDFCLERKWNSYYEQKHNLLDAVCVQCGRHFGVVPARYNHPRFGKFCSKDCYNEFQKKKPNEDGKYQCSTCKEWKPKEEFSANDSYCKVCWRERTRKYRESKKKL
jgi:hypothetical protein